MPKKQIINGWGECMICGTEDDIYGGLCETCENEEDPECICGHSESSHGDNGCEYFINEFIGDCPCESVY